MLPRVGGAWMAALCTCRAEAVLEGCSWDMAAFGALSSLCLLCASPNTQALHLVEEGSACWKCRALRANPGMDAFIFTLMLI